jgi:hypothetical protein
VRTPYCVIGHNAMTLSPFDDFLTQLRMGDWDSRLDELSEALRNRYRTRDAVAANLFTIGSRCMAPPDCKPRRMAMQRGTVEGFTPSGKLKVRFDHDPRTVWTWPAGMMLPTGDE